MQRWHWVQGAKMLTADHWWGGVQHLIQWRDDKKKCVWGLSAFLTTSVRAVTAEPCSAENVWTVGEGQRNGKSIWTCDTVTDRRGGLFITCTEESHQEVEDEGSPWHWNRWIFIHHSVRFLVFYLFVSSFLQHLNAACRHTSRQPLTICLFIFFQFVGQFSVWLQRGYSKKKKTEKSMACLCRSANLPSGLMFWCIVADVRRSAAY